MGFQYPEIRSLTILHDMTMMGFILWTGRHLHSDWRIGYGSIEYRVNRRINKDDINGSGLRHSPSPHLPGPATVSRLTTRYNTRERSLTLFLVSREKIYSKGSPERTLTQELSSIEGRPTRTGPEMVFNCIRLLPKIALLTPLSYKSS